VGLEPAVLGFHEREVEGVVQARGAQPNESVGSADDFGLQHIGVAGANFGIDAVAGNDESGVAEVGVGIGFAFKLQAHAKILAARLQDVQQLFAAYAHKTVTAAADGAAFEFQLNVVPVVERLLDVGGADGVPLTHVGQGGV